jgi:hypothetical protein
MPIKITLKQAVHRYGVNERTIYRWTKKYEVYQFPDGTYDRDQLDALVDNYGKADYLQIDWSRAACKGLPTELFYKIEEKGIRKVVDMNVFRVTCAPCPIWKQCLSYASRNENFGVWGGMTTEERKAFDDPAKRDIQHKVIREFSRYGITEAMINEAVGN